MPIAFGSKVREQAADASEVYTSLLGGHGVYVPTESTVRVMGVERQVVEQAGSSYSQYYVVPLASRGQNDLEHWSRIIDFDMAFLGFMWPVDLAQNDEDWALVFPVVNTSDYQPLSMLMVNWKLPDGSYFDKSAREIERNRVLYLRIVANLLRSWKALNQLGLLYLDYDMSHILYNSQGQVLFNFNVDLSSWGWEHPVWKVEANNLTPVPFVVDRPNMPIPHMPLDYVDPFTYDVVKAARDHGKATVAVPYTEMFAMHAIAYRLTVGCLPFYGPQVSFQPNDVGDSHLAWVDTYQEYHTFGFDSAKAENRLGSMAIEEVFVRNWEFLRTLDDGVLRGLDLRLSNSDLEQLKGLYQEFVDYFDSASGLRPRGVNWDADGWVVLPTLLQRMDYARSQRN